MGKAERRCTRCTGLMQRGKLKIRGGAHEHLRLQFVVPGTPTSLNPLKAFRQGLAGEQDDHVFDLSQMGGFLCETCGHIDLYAWFAEDSDDVEPDA